MASRTSTREAGTGRRPRPASTRVLGPAAGDGCDKIGAGLGLPVLVALCGSLLEKSTKGGLIVVGALNLGGSVEMIPNPVAVAELAVEKGAQRCLCRSRRGSSSSTCPTIWRRGSASSSTLTPPTRC